LIQINDGLENFFVRSSIKIFSRNYIRDFNNKTMVVQAIKNIKEGQEIVFNYNGEPENNAPLDWIKKIE